MSASPTIAASSAKRPLEEPSSPAADDIKTDAIKTEFNTELDDTTQNGTKDGEADVVVFDAPSASVLETQPIQSTSGANGRPGPNNSQENEANWLHLRACISTQEAATIIGKGGENVTQIRRLSGAKCTVSDYARGAVERILTVSGAVDAVSKVREDCKVCLLIDTNIL